MSEEKTQRQRDEAAMWLARMMRPDSARFRAAFEVWLASDERHGQVYERMCQRYAHSQILARSARYAGEKPLRPSPYWILPIGGGLAAAAVMLLALSHLPGIAGQQPASSIASLAARSPGARVVRLAARTGEIRSIRLSDGSRVTLDTGAILELAFDDRQRLLRLTRGRARFEVAHESRPFVVAAGSGAVIAHGTLFDVEIGDGGRVRVVLLRGAVDVRIGRASGSGAVRGLHVQQQAEFDPAGFVAAPIALPAPSPDWPTGVVDVDAMRLSDLLSRANSYATVPIELGGTELAGLKVSGRFQVDRPEILVQNLADLFDLTVDRSQPGKVILRKMSSSPKPS